MHASTPLLPSFGGVQEVLVATVAPVAGLLRDGDIVHNLALCIPRSGATLVHQQAGVLPVREVVGLRSLAPRRRRDS